MWGDAMNVATLENSKKLYELSGWIETETHWQITHGEIQDWTPETTQRPNYTSLKACPAYDCGYLLRKLPYEYADNFKDYGLILIKDEKIWCASYDYYDLPHIYVEADTPEDALTLLAIKLFELKIISKEH